MTLHRLLRVMLLTLMCLGAFGFGQWYSPSTWAQTSGQWEYQVVKADRIESNGAALEVKGLSKLGENGWEAVGINDSWVLLKRSK